MKIPNTQASDGQIVHRLLDWKGPKDCKTGWRASSTSFEPDHLNGSSQKPRAVVVQGQKDKETPPLLTTHVPHLQLEVALFLIHLAFSSCCWFLSCLPSARLKHPVASPCEVVYLLRSSHPFISLASSSLLLLPVLSPLETPSSAPSTETPRASRHHGKSLVKASTSQACVWFSNDTAGQKLLEGLAKKGGIGKELQGPSFSWTRTVPAPCLRMALEHEGSVFVHFFSLN